MKESQQDPQLKILYFFCLGSCEIPDLMKPFSKDCIDFYSLLSEEDRKWSVGWTNFTKKARKKRNLDQQLSAFNDNSDSKIVHEREKRALRLVLRSRKEFLDKNKIPVDDDASGILLDIQSLYPNTTIFSDEKWWQFFGALDIDGFPFFGHFSVYGGGGYTAPFKDDVLSSFKVSASLANYHWIDRYSRGVFIEFSVYSPDTNIFATSFMLFEIHPLGALLTQSGVKTFSIYRTHGKNSNAILAGEVIVLLYLFYIIYREIREMISKKWKYFKSVFNWVDVCIIFFTFAGGVLWVARWYQEDKVLLAYKENRDKYHSFPYAATANELFIYIVGLIVYLVTMRMMRVINIFPVVVMFLGVLKSSRGKLLAFLLPFMVLFLAFVQLAYLIFNTNPYFSSFIRTFVSLFLANLGAPLYYEMKDASAIAGPLFYVGFSLFTVMVFLNLLISIINDAIADETGNFAASANDLEFVEFIFSKINSLIRIEIVDVAELAAIREENERKAARQERRNEKRRKEKEERLQRLQEGQEAYLDLDKKLKHAEKTLLSTAAFIEQKTAKIQEKTTKMENEISQQQLSKA